MRSNRRELIKYPKISSTFQRLVEGKELVSCYKKSSFKGGIARNTNNSSYHQFAFSKGRKKRKKPLTLINSLSHTPPSKWRLRKPQFKAFFQPHQQTLGHIERDFFGIWKNFQGIHHQHSKWSVAATIMQ